MHHRQHCLVIPGDKDQKVVEGSMTRLDSVGIMRSVMGPLQIRQQPDSPQGDILEP